MFNFKFFSKKTLVDSVSNLSISKGANPNYIAKVVALKNVRPHTNANKLQLVSVDGYTVITGLNAKEGDLYVFFPIESVINHDYLSYTNSFDESSLNENQQVTGFFKKHGRIRAVRLRGIMSEGYVVPISSIIDFAKNKLKVKLKESDLYSGLEFDTIGKEKFVWKFEVPVKVQAVAVGKEKKLLKKYKSKLVDNQFSFHADTKHLKREISQLDPKDLIAIHNKIHGSSFIVSNVLVKRKLPIVDKVAKFFGAKVQETEYGPLWASRKVIKNRNFNSFNNDGYYGSDIWKIVADQVHPLLKRGMTIYGEIYGYTPTGKEIQKGYDYGCKPNQLDYVIYRINYTNIFGEVFEFTWPQIKSFCDNVGLKTPELYYYGVAEDLFPEIKGGEHWHQNFLDRMCETYLEKDCHLCKPTVPAEGVVLTFQHGQRWHALKLKSNRFVERETKQLDSGETGVEDEEMLDNNENVT